VIDLRGIFPAIVTPMREDEAIDEIALRGVVRRMLESGAHGIFAAGTNGEFYALSDAERVRVVEIVVDEVHGVVPVIAGTGAVSTRATIDLTHAAADAGAAAVSVVTPYFAAADQDQLVRHYTAVADAAHLPVMIYNIPMRTHNPVDVETVRQLAEHPQIIGAKDSSGDPAVLAGYLGMASEGFTVLAGSDGLVLTCLEGGGSGSISGMANIFPGTMVGIYESFISGDIAQARAFQDAISAFRTALPSGNPSTVVKEAVNLRGYPVGPSRAPFGPLDDRAREQLCSALRIDTPHLR